MTREGCPFPFHLKNDRCVLSKQITMAGFVSKESRDEAVKEYKKIGHDFIVPFDNKNLAMEFGIVLHPNSPWCPEDKKPKPKKICLVSCSKKKDRSKGKHQAKLLYKSNLFNKSMNYAEKHCDKTYILSAKHRVLEPDEEIKSYDLYLTDMAKPKQRMWAVRVAQDMVNKASNDDELIILAGSKYSKLLKPRLNRKGFKNISEPLKNMKIGQRLKWLNKQLKEKK